MVRKIRMSIPISRKYADIFAFEEVSSWISSNVDRYFPENEFAGWTMDPDLARVNVAVQPKEKGMEFRNEFQKALSDLFEKGVLA